MSRLKQLLWDRLEESGWRYDVEEHAKGTALLNSSLCRLSSHPGILCVSKLRSTFSKEFCVLAVACFAAPTLAAHAEILLQDGNENMTVDALVKALRPQGRMTVPDNIKAELLSKLRTAIVS